MFVYSAKGAAENRGVPAWQGNSNAEPSLKYLYCNNCGSRPPIIILSFKRLGDEEYSTKQLMCRLQNYSCGKRKSGRSFSGLRGGWRVSVRKVPTCLSQNLPGRHTVEMWCPEELYFSLFLLCCPFNWSGPYLATVAGLFSTVDKRISRICALRARNSEGFSEQNVGPDSESFLHTEVRWASVQEGVSFRVSNFTERLPLPLEVCGPLWPEVPRQRRGLFSRCGTRLGPQTTRAGSILPSAHCPSAWLQGNGG